MNTVLTISDSVQGTLYDLIRCTATIKEYGLDPLSVVPRIAYDDGTSEESDVSEMLDYAFGQCDFSVLAMGFITEPEVILYAADKLDKNKTAPVIACPSIISDEGEVLVGGEVYSALCDRLLQYADFIIVNPYFSYKGFPISVASREISTIPFSLASLINKSKVFMAIPCLL